MIPRLRSSMMHLALASSLAALIAPAALTRGEAYTSTRSDPPARRADPDEVSRQRKRYLQRQARKQTRKNKK